MPRSATDATRFTSTTPHASAKLPPNPPKNAAPQRTPGPAGETPQQKVKRLRAAADRARDAQVSTFDKVIVKGESLGGQGASVYGAELSGITFICGGVTVYALGDMMIYNRRKRALFFEEQKGLHAAALHNARMALAQGTASEEDIDFISREDEEAARVERVKKAKAEERHIYQNEDLVIIWAEDGGRGEVVGSSERRLGYESLSEEDDSMGARESDIIRAIEDKKASVENTVKQAFADEKERQKAGGPLDRLGTPASRTTESEDEQPKSGGWTSFMTRK